MDRPGLAMRVAQAVFDALPLALMLIAAWVFMVL